MSVEFIDTNVLVYAHDGGSGEKHHRSVALLTRLFEEQTGALSVQVLSEFYAVATRKLAMTSREAADVIRDLMSWNIHQPAPGDLLDAARIHQRYKISWWDALIIQSASHLGASVVWSEDLTDEGRFGTVRVRNPFR